MRISPAESTAVFTDSPRAPRNPNRIEGSEKNQRDKNVELLKKRPKKIASSPCEPGKRRGNYSRGKGF
jgi:hypothetical protein